MIRCIARIPQPTDAVSMYRGVGPLSQLHEMYPFIFTTSHEFNWSVLSAFDFVYIVRPCTDKDRELLDLALRMKKPVWVDYDDNILEVPNYNQTHHFYSNRNIQDNVRYILSKATVCTVSTEHLATVLNPYRPGNAPCTVIANAFPDHLLDWDQPNVKRNNIITWRGSRTHEKDLSEAMGFFKDVNDLLPKWTSVFFGEPSYRVLDVIEPHRRAVVPSQDIIDYFHSFKNIGSTFHVVPLEDNSFNRAKSNIAWIEATWAGAVTIAPFMNEWMKPGILHAPFFGADPKFFSQSDVYARSLELSQNYIRENLMLSHVNRKRIEVIESL